MMIPKNPPARDAPPPPFPSNREFNRDPGWPRMFHIPDRQQTPRVKPTAGPHQAPSSPSLGSSHLVGRLQRGMFDAVWDKMPHLHPHTHPHTFTVRLDI